MQYLLYAANFGVVNFVEIRSVQEILPYQFVDVFVQSLQALHFNQAPVPITVAPDFVGIAQGVDDHAAALNFCVHRCVRVFGKPVGKAGQIDIVDEIGIERRFGKLRGGAGCIRWEVGQDNGVGRTAKPLYPRPFFVVQADIVFRRDAPLVLAVGQVIKNIGEIGHGNLCQIAVLLKLLGADLVLPEVAEQRAADKGPAVDLHGFARAQIRFVAQFQAHIAHVFMIIIVVAQHKNIGLARLVAGCLKLPHGGQAVAEIAGVGNHIGFGMKGVGAAMGVGKELDFHGDVVSGSLQRDMGNSSPVLYHSI